MTGLALAGGLADEIGALEDPMLAPFFVVDGRPDSRARDYFAGFDLVVSYLYDPGGVFETNLARVSSALFLAGPHRPEESLNLHATDVFLGPLELLGIREADAVPHLAILPPDGVRLGPGAWLALHPGSGSERKNWLERQWRRLIEDLARASEFHLLLIGGEAEGDRLTRLAEGHSPAQVQLARDLPLPRLAGYLTACRFFLGHDSGITHLAAALGLPGLVLWGETNPAIWRPRSEGMTVLRARSGLAGLAVEEVLATLNRLLRSSISER